MNMRNLFLTLAFGLCSGVFAQNTTVFESPIMGCGAHGIPIGFISMTP